MSRILRIIAGAGLWTYFVIPVFEGIFNVGNGVGMLVSGLVFLWGVFDGTVSRLFKKIVKKKALKILSGAVCVMLCAALTLFAVISGFMISAAGRKSPENATVIVLGCAVMDKGPSNMLRQRIDAAAEYLEANPGSVCIASGCRGPDEKMSEAGCIKDELIKLGIEPSRIFLEENSRNTRENLAFSAEIIRENGLNTTVAVVTSEYHQYRASLDAKRHGLVPYAVSSKTVPGLIGTYWIRETGGILLEWLGFAG